MQNQQQNEYVQRINPNYLLNMQQVDQQIRTQLNQNPQSNVLSSMNTQQQQMMNNQQQQQQIMNTQQQQQIMNSQYQQQMISNQQQQQQQQMGMNQMNDQLYNYNIQQQQPNNYEQYVQQQMKYQQYSQPQQQNYNMYNPNYQMRNDYQSQIEQQMNQYQYHQNSIDQQNKMLIQQMQNYQQPNLQQRDINKQNVAKEEQIQGQLGEQYSQQQEMDQYSEQEKIYEQKQYENNENQYEIDESNQQKDGKIENEEINRLKKDFTDAIKRGDTECVQEMMNEFIQQIDLVNQLDIRNKQTPLYLATTLPDQNKSYEIFKLLIENGANYKYKDNLNQTVLFYVARDGKLKHLKTLLKMKDIDLNEVDNYGQTPLFYASREGHEDLVELLLENGVDANIKDRILQQSCLFYAIKEGHLGTVKLLVEKGNVDINQYDSKKQTPLGFSKKYNKKMITEYLQKSKKSDEQVVTDNVVNDSSKNNKLKKKRKYLEESKIAYKLVYQPEGSNYSKELTESDFVNLFSKQYPEVANILLNPDQNITEDMLQQAKKRDTWEKVAKKIMNSIWKYKGAYLFHTKVDPVKLKLEDYFQIVKYPMDFGTIKQKLGFNLYENQQSFLDDMKLVFDNCVLYNGADTDVGQIAIDVQNEFNRLVRQSDIINC